MKRLIWIVFAGVVALGASVWADTVEPDHRVPMPSGARPP